MKEYALGVLKVNRVAQIIWPDLTKPRPSRLHYLAGGFYVIQLRILCEIYSRPFSLTILHKVSLKGFVTTFKNISINCVLAASNVYTSKEACHPIFK